MNETQSVFAIFFAIFLGTIANVQPRWKAFNWPLLFLMPHGKRRFIACRLALSFFLLNALPVAFFAFALWMLIGAGTDSKDWTGETVRSVIFHGVVPSFASFAFYRLWLGAIEFAPTVFYVSKQEDLPEDLRTECSPEIEPSVENLHIIPRASCANIVFGLVYLVIPTVFLIKWP